MVRLRTSSIHFHCPAPQSSNHIGHGLNAININREGNIFYNRPRAQSSMLGLSAASNSFMSGRLGVPMMFEKGRILTMSRMIWCNALDPPPPPNILCSNEKMRISGSDHPLFFPCCFGLLATEKAHKMLTYYTCNINYCITYSMTI